MAHVIVHLNTVAPGARTMPDDEWCMVKIQDLPIVPAVGDILSLPEFDDWIRPGKVTHPRVDNRVIEPDWVTIYVNVRYHLNDLMGFRTHLVGRGWRRCEGNPNPSFPVQWHHIREGYPEVGADLVCMRGPGKTFETYHGDGVWSGSVVGPDYWAYWDYPVDLQDAFSLIRFDTLCGIPSPKGV